MSYMAGTIGHSEMHNFSRLIYRQSRGKVLCHFDQKDFKTRDLDGKENVRVVFLLVFQSGGVLVERMMKICDAFMCKRYVLPQDGYAKPEEIARRLSQLKANIMNVTGLVAETKKQLRDYLKGIQAQPWCQGTGVSATMLYSQYIKQEKAIYATLNKLRRHRSLSYGYLWSSLTRDEFLEAFYGPEHDKGIIDLPDNDAR